MGLKEVCFFIFLCVGLASAASRDRNQKKYKVVCYFDSRPNDKIGDGQFLIEDIDPYLCTHLVYGSAKIDNNQIAAYDPHLDLKENSGLGGYQRFNNHKKTNPQLTTLIAISYNVLYTSKVSRATFIESVIKYCQKYDFDGLYINDIIISYEEQERFPSLLEELKAAFEPHGLILTAEFTHELKRMSYSSYLDFIIVRGYDLHGYWDGVVGHPAPLYPRPEESKADKFKTVENLTDYTIHDGTPRSKVILGMALYGQAFTLANPANHSLGSASIGFGRTGSKMAYNEICKNNWTEVFVAKIEAPYAYSGDQWVGYDNVKSIGIKVDYLIEQKLGGGMVRSLEKDDFRGNCFGEKYPLLSTITRKLNGEVIRPTVDPNITVTNPIEDTSRTVDPNIIVTKPPVLTTAYPGKGFKNILIDYVKFKLNFIYN